MGRAAGEARKDHELRLAARSSEGYQRIPPRYGFYLIALFLLLAMFGSGLKANAASLLLLTASVIALLLSRRLGRLLGSLLPVHVGLWGGAAVGSIFLLAQGAPLTPGNIAIHLILGGLCGFLVLLIRRSGKR